MSLSRDRILEEVRAAFSSVFLGKIIGKMYVSTNSGEGGCETCGYGAPKLISMDGVNEVIDYLKENTYEKEKQNETIQS